MKITISGTEQELAAFLNNFNKSEELVQLLVKNNALEQKVEYDDAAIASYFDRVSWATVHLAKTIWENAGEQSDDKGLYLTTEQVESFGMGERTASARVGGSRKVCGALEIDDILFLKIVSNTKRYYLRSDAIPTIMQCLADQKQGYQDYLEEL